MTPAIVWLRRDLRLRDNAALSAAALRGGPVVPVFIWDPQGEGAWAPGASSRAWLHHSLVALEASLRERGSRLVVARGASAHVLEGLARELGAGAVYWNRRYEPGAAVLEGIVNAALERRGVDARGFCSALLFEPPAVLNRQGGPFQVFTPFWRHCLQLPVPPPVALPAGAFGPRVRKWPRSLECSDLDLLPKAGRDPIPSGGWSPGEKGASRRLRRFVAGGLKRYGRDRDRPGRDGTSLLSPHLHFGEIGPRQAWAAVKALSADTGVFPRDPEAATFLREIGWREFAHHLLFHFPTTPSIPLRPGFSRFPWAEDKGHAMLRAWQEGRTGYPIVDAGMRQLQESGWMHNRVRMVAASFLVKHLRISWIHGARWFWNTLVDADLANNTLGWQWSAGCGADAAPYFRIFAPVKQGMRWDPEGDYVRRWVPELGPLPTRFLHAPWEAPESVLASAGVGLGTGYPRPIVDHGAARAAALGAFRSLRGNTHP